MAYIVMWPTWMMCCDQHVTQTGEKNEPTGMKPCSLMEFRVDLVDQMACRYSVREAKCRGMDLAGINKRLPYKDCTRRKHFIPELLMQLSNTMSRFSNKCGKCQIYKIPHKMPSLQGKCSICLCLAYVSCDRDAQDKHKRENLIQHSIKLHCKLF